MSSFSTFSVSFRVVFRAIFTLLLSLTRRATITRTFPCHQKGCGP